LERLVAAAAGADAWLIETCSDDDFLDEVGEAASRADVEFPPVLVSFTYRHERWNTIRSFKGASPGELAEASDCPFYNLQALGVNCGRDITMFDILKIIEEYRENTTLPTFVRPNAGTPKQVDGNWLYPHGPEYMASWLSALLEAGVRMVGGCCGTTPAHIAAFRPIVDTWKARKSTKR
jgi:methionine synthase I (cobalamin-dependent)